MDTRQNEEYRIALEFDLSSLPPTAEIHAVTLRLRSATPDRAGTTAIYAYAGNGTIEASDMTAGSLAATHTPSSPSPEFVDVTASVLERWNNGDRWAGFTLRQEPLGTTDGGWDCPNNLNPPLLTVEYSGPDSTPPVITPNVVGTEGTNGWYTGDVSVTWAVVDDESPIGNQSGCEAQTVTADTGGVTFTCTAESDGGSSSQSVTIQRDATAPTITFVDRTAANSDGWNNGDVNVNWYCSDTTSGPVAESVSQTVSGEGADQSATGSCTDQAGNGGSASVTYSVVFRWTGFLSPVDNLPTVNTVNAGAAIPVKFSLRGDYGLGIFAAGYPKVQAVACGGGGSSGGSDAIEETVTAGNSALQYDATNQTYTYVWKTDKAWAGTCRTLTVKLVDGTEHSALFQFAGKVRSAAAAGEVAAVEQLFLPAVNR